MTAKVEIFDELDAVARDAGGALDRAQQPSIFTRLDWFRLVHEHCPPPGRLVAAKAEESGAFAWLFLAGQEKRASAYANWYCLRFGASLAGERTEIEPLKAIAGQLRDSFSRVELYPLVASDPLKQAFRAAGWLVYASPASVSWRIATEGMDFDSYWASRPARLRNTVKRKARLAGLEIGIYRRFDPDAWAEYEAVFAASWKPDEGSMPFLRALAEQEGAAGTLRLGIARKDGLPVAAQLWLVENEVATIHKLAYAEAAREFSPGTVLSMEMFRAALDRDHVSLIDFGTGDDAYKAEWMDSSEPLYRLSAYNPLTLDGLRGAARAAASALVRGARSD